MKTALEGALEAARTVLADHLKYGWVNNYLVSKRDNIVAHAIITLATDMLERDDHIDDVIDNLESRLATMACEIDPTTATPEQIADIHVTGKMISLAYEQERPKP
jgi:hypothetical protein